MSTQPNFGIGETLKQVLIAGIECATVAVADFILYMMFANAGIAFSDLQTFFYACMNAVGFAGISYHAMKVAISATGTTIETNEPPTEPPA